MAQSTLPPPPLRPVSRCGLSGGWSNHIPFQQSRGRYIFATAEYVKRLREECLRENKPLHRHTRFRRQELAQDEINPDVLAMSGHIARRCSEQKRVRIPAMKVSEWGHLLRALEIERVCH